MGIFITSSKLPPTRQSSGCIELQTGQCLLWHQSPLLSFTLVFRTCKSQRLCWNCLLPKWFTDSSVQVDPGCLHYLKDNLWFMKNSHLSFVPAQQKCRIIPRQPTFFENCLVPLFLLRSFFIPSSFLLHSFIRSSPPSLLNFHGRSQISFHHFFPFQKVWGILSMKPHPYPRDERDRCPSLLLYT